MKENKEYVKREFKRSELVDALLKRNRETPIKVYEGEYRKLTEPEEGRVNEAYNKICEMWNKDEKSRGFVKFLIKSFTPRNPLNKILNFSEEELKEGKNRCCILYTRLAGVGDIADHWSKVGLDKMAARLEAHAEGRDRITKEARKRIKEAERNMPVEVKNATIAYFSDNDKCDKYLSGEAWYALMEFIEDCLFGDEKEVQFLINRKLVEKAQESIPSEKKLNKDQVNKVAGTMTYRVSDFIDEETAKKLQAIKKELKK